MVICPLLVTFACFFIMRLPFPYFITDSLLLYASIRNSGLGAPYAGGVYPAESLKFLAIGSKRVFCAVFVSRSLLPGRSGWFCGGCAF
jgi:hypothetical protein